MDSIFKSRKTKKDKEHKTRELYGNYTAKHVRIQEKCQENHITNLQKEKTEKNKRKNRKK